MSSTATAITQPSPQRDNETLNQKREYQDFAGDFCVNRSRDCINVSVAANLSLNIAYKDNQANQEAAFKQALKESTVRTILNRQRWNAGFSIITEANTNGGMRVSASASKNVRSIERIR